MVVAIAILTDIQIFISQFTVIGVIVHLKILVLIVFIVFVIQIYVSKTGLACQLLPYSCVIQFIIVLNQSSSFPWGYPYSRPIRSLPNERPPERYTINEMTPGM
jgi:hypothetical protein